MTPSRMTFGALRAASGVSTPAEIIEVLVERNTQVPEYIFTCRNSNHCSEHCAACSTNREVLVVFFHREQDL